MSSQKLGVRYLVYTSISKVSPTVSINKGFVMKPSGLPHKQLLFYKTDFVMDSIP